MTMCPWLREEKRTRKRKERRERSFPHCELFSFPNPQWMLTRFEALPNELLLDLFENYIRLIDIYVAFARLNHRRFNELISSSFYRISIPSKDIFHQQSFEFYSTRIVSLSLSSFCSDLDFRQFVHLHSLHIEKPTRQQLLTIDAQYMPELRSLSLYPCWFTFHELPKYLTNISDQSPFKNLLVFRRPDGKILRFSPNKSKWTIEHSVDLFLSFREKYVS